MDAKFNLLGKRFGRLLVVKQVPNVERGRVVRGRRQQHRAWLVRCDCGVEKVMIGTALRRGNTVSCGCWRAEKASIRAKRRGPESHVWRGGRSKTPKGYILIRSAELPNGTIRDRVYEHQLVMMRALGRVLRPGENVHHRNGVRDDNRIENLELWLVPQPYGQRVDDHVAFAKRILREYEPAALMFRGAPCLTA